MAILNVKGESSFESEVMKSNVPTLVDFWAEWCPPCRAYSPVIEDVAKDYGSKLKLVKINVDENEAISSRYGISSIPTTFLVVKGKIKASWTGAMQKPALKKWIEENLRAKRD